VHLLAPPEPLPLDFTGLIGAAVFSKIGCASCHIPALVTGSSSVSAISRKVKEGAKVTLDKETTTTTK